MHRLFIGSVITLSLFLTTTALYYGPVNHGHWNELRDTLNTSHKQKTEPPFVIDTFQNPIHNDLGFWHGSGENLSVQHGPGFIRLLPKDPDQNFHTQFDSNTCYSLMPWYNDLLHVVFEGTDKFSVSLNQHNDECNPHRSPFPSVADSVQAERYVVRPDAEESRDDDWDYEDDDYDEDDDMDMVTPRDTYGKLGRHCQNGRRPKHAKGSAKGSAKIPLGHRDLYIPLTHFEIDFNRVVSVSFHGFYTEEPMTLHRVEIVSAVPVPSPENGHFRLPGKLPSGRMESLPTVGQIDDEIIQMIQVFKDQLGIESSYFRPPFGTVAARLRQQLSRHIANPYIVNWSVDVEDWLWANTSSPEKQLDAFYRGVAKGGNLAVMHYLNPTTIGYLPQFIRHVKSAGYHIMRIDQCLEDASAPAL
ncbi:hypothetical protein PENARI_c006G11715 [Penicillium arizonense]|uniref:NodB homology domain-containing protein n=1 Tax=Penicillium arizonense TaxID=1835702 RepID=A0A1F5LM82_PENAI|nr:hypothetical protein PENARI_c006G11715 [Penicillium arizonense]OGE54225.1 hypothetical protein PENARI_c006G11715 [Penicillium arizonense]